MRPEVRRPNAPEPLIKPVDTRMRRPWPEYWAHLKHKDIRAEVCAQTTQDAAPGRPGDRPDGGSMSKLIRLEIARRWEAFCRHTQNLEAYKAEVAGRSDQHAFTTLAQRRAVEQSSDATILRRLRRKRQAQGRGPADADSAG